MGEMWTVFEAKINQTNNKISTKKLIQIHKNEFYLRMFITLEL